MKYAIIDMINNGDSFESIYEHEAEAINAADREWARMSNFDKNRRLTFTVVRAEADEYGCVDMNTAIVVKSFK